MLNDKKKVYKIVGSAWCARGWLCLSVRARCYSGSKRLGLLADSSRFGAVPAFLSGLADAGLHQRLFGAHVVTLGRFLQVDMGVRADDVDFNVAGNWAVHNVGFMRQLSDPVA